MPPNSVPVVPVCSFVVVSSPSHCAQLVPALDLASLSTHVTHLALHAYLSLSLSCPHPGSCTITIAHGLSLLVLSATLSSRLSFSLDLLHDPFRSLCSLRLLSPKS